MPSDDVDGIHRVKGMHVFSSLGASNLDALFAVLVRTVGTDYIGAVERERDAVYAASHSGERVLAYPIMGVPESDKRVASTDSQEGTVGRVLYRIGCACVGGYGVKEGLLIVSFYVFNRSPWQPRRKWHRKRTRKLRTIVGQSSTLTVPSLVVANSSLPELLKEHWLV